MLKKLTKLCTKCKKELSIIEFKKGNYKDGLNCWCKDCCKKYLNNYKNIHKIKIRKQLKLYQITHIKEIKLYLNAHKEEIKKRMNKWRNNNKRKLNEYRKEYRRIHKDQIREQEKEHKKKKRRIDIKYRIRCYLSKRIWQALKGINKSKTTMKLLGCSIDFFKLHLQSKFQSGMSFSNYGKWHIDHIRPCASFDLTKPEEQRKCFHYTNLQPLWAEDNWRKNDNYISKEK